MRSSCGKNNYLFLLDVFLHCFLPRHTNIINKVTTSYQHFQKKNTVLNQQEGMSCKLTPHAVVHGMEATTKKNFRASCLVNKT
jgi:hypothetical protein